MAKRKSSKRMMKRPPKRQRGTNPRIDVDVTIVTDDAWYECTNREQLVEVMRGLHQCDKRMSVGKARSVAAAIKGGAMVVHFPLFAAVRGVNNDKRKSWLHQMQIEWAKFNWKE